MSSTKPIRLIATGGTIASYHDGEAWTDVDGATLLDDVARERPDVVADVIVEDVATGSSSNLSTADMVGIARRVERLVDEGAAGVIVTHGTDTMELTAFVVQLLLGVDGRRPPVVFTGSMRVRSDTDPDGPRNLADALSVARDPGAVGRDVIVCMGGELHAADRVRKIDSRSLEAFTSHPFDPIGSVGAGGVDFVSSTRPRPSADDLVGDVSIITCFPGVRDEDVRRAAEGRDGVVVEVFGDLNAPMSIWGILHDLASQGMLILLSSPTYTERIDDDDLRLLGALGCGGLTAQRARLGLMAALSRGADRSTVAGFLEEIEVVHRAGPLGTRPGEQRV